MCRETSALFACGHRTTCVDECTRATTIQLQAIGTRSGVRTTPVTKNLCTGVMKYPPRERNDSCIDCWAEQLGLIEVVDMPKGRDDIPPSHRPGYHYHPSLHAHSRRLFRPYKDTGDEAENAKILFWTPQHHRADERKLALQSGSVDVQTPKSKQTPKAAPPAVGARKIKAKAPAATTAPKAPTKSQAGKGAKGKK